MEASTSGSGYWSCSWPVLVGAVLVGLGLFLSVAADREQARAFGRQVEAYRTSLENDTVISVPIPGGVTGLSEPGVVQLNTSDAEELPAGVLTALWRTDARAASAGLRGGAWTFLFMGGVTMIFGVIRCAVRPVEQALTGSDGIYTKLEEHSALLDKLGDRMLISDAAKRVVFRAKDREAMRQAIREDIDRSDFDAALVLVDEMGEKYGYREEAEEFREEILVTRQAMLDERLTRAITSLDGHLDHYDWQRASQEASKIRRLFPDHPRAHGIEQRVREAREVHKHDLERQFLDAAQRDDVDRAWELMKELDEHMTEADAEPFREIARGVIGKKRENLGVQFKLAVHDRDWIAAVDVGEQIIREFPNTKMSSEVRGMLDLLRERAAGQRAARA